MASLAFPLWHCIGSTHTSYDPEPRADKRNPIPNCDRIAIDRMVSSVGCVWKLRVGRNLPRAALFHPARFGMMTRLAGALTPQLSPISQNDWRVRGATLSPKFGMPEYCLHSTNLLALRASIELGPHRQMRWDCGCPGHLVEDP